MAAFQEDIASFERLDTQVLGVSSDDLETHERFAASLGLSFPLITDTGGKLAAQYGRGRIAFLIAMIVAFLGPWVFDLINVPAQYECSPNIRLY